MLVSSVMTREPLVVSPDTHPSAAYELMSQHDIRHLPVVVDGRLRGVVSDRDLLEVIGSHPGSEAAPEAPDVVADLMSVELASIGPDDTVVTATVEFLVHRIGCLPVVEGDALVGILSEMDMLKAYTQLVKNGTIPAAGERVDTLMATHLATLAPGATLREAANLLRDRHVRHVPVVEDGALVGMLSDRDLRRALGDQVAEDDPIETLMATETLEIAAEASLSEAAFLMALGKISGLPVLADGKLVGLLTLTDLLEHCLETLRDPETPAKG